MQLYDKNYFKMPMTMFIFIGDVIFYGSEYGGFSSGGYNSHLWWRFLFS